ERSGRQASLGCAPASLSPFWFAPLEAKVMFFRSLQKAGWERARHRGGGWKSNRRQRFGRRPILENLEDRLTPSGGVSGPPFAFSDSFYLANGINPTNILNRVGSATSASAFVAETSAPDANHNNIRITETTGGFDNAGTPLYYTINGMVTPGTFTNDA